MPNYKLPKNQSRQKRAKNKWIKTFILSFIVLIILFNFTLLYFVYGTSFKKVPFLEYNDIPKESNITLISEGVIHESYHSPIQKEYDIYIPLDFIKYNIDENIFWDSREHKLIVTSQTMVMRMAIDDLNYSINNVPGILDLPIYLINDMPYMPISLLEDIYEVSFSLNYDGNILTLKLTDTQTVQGVVSRNNSRLRNAPSSRSSYALSVSRNEIVTIYEYMGNFTKVSLQDGTIGYLSTNRIRDIRTLPPLVIVEPFVMASSNIDERIVLVWDQVFSPAGNSAPWRLQPHAGLHVLSPTWFSFDLNTLNGDIVSIADRNYVDWAHSHGYQVWGLIDDFPQRGGPNVANAILPSTAKREHVILQLLELIETYNLDGINIDFEYILYVDSRYYIQFMRELFPLMDSQGKILSVDVFVPRPWTAHYNRAALSLAAHYVIIMAYDEHYAGSASSGPVASIGFVEDAIVQTLLEVPSYQILLGLPFYQRIWREWYEDGELQVSRYRDTGMQFAYNMFIQNGAEFVWLEDKGIYYGNFTVIEDGLEVTYRVWLEDERSMQKKLDLATTYDLRGVAGWKRGLELPSIWDMLYYYSKH
jgi:spore germination protein YaaH